MKINTSYNGFSLVELIVSLLIITVGAGGIIIGTMHVKKTLNDIRLKQLAYEKLNSYTENWKGRIATNDIPSVLSNCEDNIILKETSSVSGSDWEATLCYELSQPYVGDSNAKRWEVITSIEWENTSKVKKELSFYVIQMVF